MSSAWPLRTLRWTYVAFIAGASAMAIRSAHAGTGEGHHSARFVLFLAVPELIAALSLLVRPVERIACAVLVAIYVVAGAVSAASGDIVAPLRFLYYAATAIFIVTAGRERPAGAAEV
ncbi:MAG TPA: hypothetical protein VKS60_15585 [Stellaceae bacterium]|nr:hypothetical protein [Stellaceae bacterium]